MSRRPRQAAVNTQGPQCSIQPTNNEVQQTKTRRPIGRNFQRAQKTTIPAPPSSTHTNPSSHSSENLTAARAWFQDANDKGVKGIRRDFVSHVRAYVPEGTTKAYDSHMDKNRYEDIFLLDHSRVKLDKLRDDYIHASRVKIVEDVQYICTQGPMDNTVEDFWHMVLQERTKVIVQLCRNVESGEKKSDEYFAPGHGKAEKYHSVTVHTKTHKRLNHLREVTKSELVVKFEDQSHKVVHYLYDAWPDHFVPDSAVAFRELHNLVAKDRGKAPVVVHCSAGVGRTGTFVGAEMLLHMLLERKDVDSTVIDMVKHLRDQRMHAVQTDTQYLFMYRCVLDVLQAAQELSGVPEVDEFLRDYNDLIQRKRKEKEAAKKHR
ncbi:Protein-tyrosine phosphatase containing protein [Aphelenchoides avenae]|nr:Protein-tyrosine phosphatase containing protein [Aphelenchus avenae]